MKILYHSALIQVQFIHLKIAIFFFFFFYYFAANVLISCSSPDRRIFYIENLDRYIQRTFTRLNFIFILYTATLLAYTSLHYMPCNQSISVFFFLFLLPRSLCEYNEKFCRRASQGNYVRVLFESFQTQNTETMRSLQTVVASWPNLDNRLREQQIR